MCVCVCVCVYVHACIVCATNNVYVLHGCVILNIIMMLYECPERSQS